MYFFGIFAFSTPDKHPFFEISEMTTHPTMTPTFESAMLSFSPGVNSRAELVTLASSGINNLALFSIFRDLRRACAFVTAECRPLSGADTKLEFAFYNPT